MSKIRLAVLYGGVSGEHEVSCLSATSILKNLNRERYDITVIGISREGRWFLQKNPPEPLTVQPGPEVVVRPGRGLEIDGHPLGLDVAFPITHGVRGEDGRLQGLLEWAEVPYAGAGVLGSALGMDKAFAKQIWEAEGLPVVPYLVVRAGETATDAQRRAVYDQAVEALGSPLFIKPANSGSSVGVAKVSAFSDWGPALDQAFSVDKKVLIETAVDAREIEVSVLGSVNPVAYGPGEVVPSHEFYDYDAKYLDPDGADLVIPAPLPPEVSRVVLDLAVRAYTSLDTVGFARVDFFVGKTDHQVWLNEINTLPGFTTISMFPRMAMAGGMTYGQVLDAIIDQAGVKS